MSLPAVVQPVKQNKPSRQEKATDFTSMVKNWIGSCTKANGIPHFRTKYQGKHFGDDLLQGVCWRAKHVENKWFKNVPKEQMAKIRANTGQWKSFVEQLEKELEEENPEPQEPEPIEPSQEEAYGFQTGKGYARQYPPVLTSEFTMKIDAEKLGNQQEIEDFDGFFNEFKRGYNEQSQKIYGVGYQFKEPVKEPVEPPVEEPEKEIATTPETASEEPGDENNDKEIPEE